MPEPLISIFTRPEFFEKKDLRKKTRGLSGVYAIFTNDWSVCEYVGESCNVNDRLSSHLKNRSFYNIFVVRCPDDRAVRRVLEAILILFFHPRWNVEITDMNKKMKMNEVMPGVVSNKEKIKDQATIDAAAQILENLDFAEAERKKKERNKVKK